ncbi:MAG: competence/damage-inducible protein A [Candidatus Brocadiales bacterium]|nr:competence/damage-inducible protein A [Candidatus Brocadiales bacterium]
MKTAEITSTGNELLQGEVLNTNASYIAEELTRKGITILCHTTVGDDIVALGSALERAIERADLIIVTGGLGPTRDDITRKAVALSCQKKLILDETAFSHIKETYHCRHMEMPTSNVRQAMIPEGATLIPNKTGTAPGFSLKHDNKEIICLPGVPGEMRQMFQEWVLPHIQETAVIGIVTAHRKLHVFGLPEALVGEKIEHLMAPESNPMAGTMVHEGIITLRITAEAREEAQARTLLDKAEEEIRQLLGEAVFGRDEETLEEVVADLLKKHKKTIAIAESCTGGLVGDLLTNVPGISQHLLEDVVTYTIKSKADLIGIPEELLRKTGVVNPETARAMAIAIRNKTGSDIALSITGVAGPTSPHPREPVGLVYIALATKEGVEHKEFHFSGSRRWIKLLAAKNALDMVRLKLLKM